MSNWWNNIWKIWYIFCFFHNGLMNVHQICHLPSKLGDSKINFFSTHSKHQININKTYGRFKRKTSSYVQYLTCCWNVLVDLGPLTIHYRFLTKRSPRNRSRIIGSINAKKFHILHQIYNRSDLRFIRLVWRS